MMWTYVLKLIVLLPLVCGLMIGSLYLWRKLETRMPGAAATRGIAVRETMMISPGVKLAVVEFEGRRLLVSVARTGVTLVDKGGAVSASDELVPAAAAPTPSFRDALASLTKGSRA
ncbi:FliO/MopB family protein [Sphingomonas sp.]|uniref:FliO/MopB family protein n=1 Tax=Sphingomonas sp. TaxID=28214 RepID=UPI0035C870DB